MRFCTNCGFALTGDPRYCPGCGIPAGQPPDSGPPATSSPVSDPPMDQGPPVAPPGQGPPDLWGRQDLRDPWRQLDPPDLWSKPDPPDLWSKPDPPDLWTQPDSPAPGSKPDPPGPWSKPDPPDPWSQPDLPSRWGRPGTVDPPSRPDPRDPRATEPPADPAGAQDPFEYLFDASGSPTAVTPEIGPVAGRPSDDSPGPDGAPGRPARSPGRLTILALVAAVALLITGSLVILRALHHNSQPNATTTRLHSPTAGGSSRGASQPAVGSDAVAIAPAAAGQAHTQQVAALLKAYFRSINSRDYVGYSRLFIPQMRESVQNFNAGYRTTTDSGATLAGLSATGTDGLAATVTFTSHQLPADSHDHATCDKWDVVLFLRPAGGGYLITHSPAGYHPSVHPCA